MKIPDEPKIYHIVHVDRLSSIIRNSNIWCDAEVESRAPSGTTIGMNHIKQRRLFKLKLSSYQDLHVGACVPFYFCPRSIMLFLIYKANSPDLSYLGGQSSIIHLEADMYQTVNWANEHGLRWAFTLSNAGAYYFEDRCDLRNLDEIDWAAVQETNWQQCKERKQAEFLIEQRFPWKLITRVGVISQSIKNQVNEIQSSFQEKPPVEIKPDWYY